MVRLGDVCEIKLGKTPPRGVCNCWDNEKLSSNVWVSIADMANTVDGKIQDSKEYITDYAIETSGIPVVKEGTLLLSFKLTLGRTAIAGRNLYTNEAIAALPIKPEFSSCIDLTYLTTYFSFFDWVGFASKDEKLLGKTLNKKKLAEVPISLPLLSVQREIVARLEKELGEADRLAAKFKRIAEIADDAFKAELDETFRSVEGEKVRLGDVCENHDNRRIPITKAKRKPGKYPYYGASGIVDYVDDFIFDGDYLLVSEDGANLVARTTPIAFSISGKAWVNNHAHILSFPNLETQRFVEYFFASFSVAGLVTGAAQPKLTQMALNNILIPLPSLTSQDVIVAKLDAEKARCEKLKAAALRGLAAAEDLRKAILAEAFEQP